MGTFLCQNCNQDSDYSRTEVHTNSNNSFVLCQFCEAKHHLHISHGFGEPLKSVAGGLFEPQR